MLLRYVTHFMHTYAIYLTKYVTSISLALYIEWKQNVYRAFYIIEKYSFIILKYEIFGICDCDVIAIEYARACIKYLLSHEMKIVTSAKGRAAVTLGIPSLLFLRVSWRIGVDMHRLCFRIHAGERKFPIVASP